MKKALSILLVIAIFCLCFIPSFSANTVTLSVSADKTSVNVGDTITVYVNISKDSSLGALDFYLNYNTEYFTYVEGSATASSLLNAVLNDGTSGKIKFSGASVGVVNTAGTLLTAKFKVAKVGGSFSVSVNLASDGDNNKVTSSVATKGITTSCAHGGAKWVETKAPTCTAKGEKKATCSTCGKELTESISTVAHAFDEWVVVTPATESELGLKEHTCTACGAKENAEIPLLETTTTETTTQLDVETTTKAENIGNGEKDDNGNSRLIECVISFVAGACVGVGIVFLILGKKKKEN